MLHSVKVYYTNYTIQEGGLLILLSTFLIEYQETVSMVMLVNSFQQQQVFYKVQQSILFYFLFALEIYQQIQKYLLHSMIILSLISKTTNENDVTQLNESKFAGDYQEQVIILLTQKASLQSDLKMIDCRCRRWRINLKQKKTNVLLFKSKHKGESEKTSIKINQTAITAVPEKRVLEVTIDEKLTFKSHINYIKRNFTIYNNFQRNLL